MTKTIYGNYEVVQRRGNQLLIREWRSWATGRNAALMEEIAMEDWSDSNENRRNLDLGSTEKKEMAMKGVIPKFNY